VVKLNPVRMELGAKILLNRVNKVRKPPTKKWELPSKLINGGINWENGWKSQGRVL